MPKIDQLENPLHRAYFAAAKQKSVKGLRTYKGRPMHVVTSRASNGLLTIGFGLEESLKAKPVSFSFNPQAYGLEPTDIPLVLRVAQEPYGEASVYGVKDDRGFVRAGYVHISKKNSVSLKKGLYVFAEDSFLEQQLETYAPSFLPQ